MGELRKPETQDDFDRLAKRAFSLFKAGAKRRGKPVKIGLDAFWAMARGSCVFCGAKGSNSLKYGGMKIALNGIDRLDSAGDYEPGNVVSCCRFCNSLKGTMKPEDWFDFIESVAQNGFESDFPKNPERKSKRYFKGW